MSGDAADEPAYEKKKEKNPEITYQIPFVISNVPVAADVVGRACVSKTYGD